MWSSDRHGAPRLWIVLVSILLAFATGETRAELLIATARDGAVEALSRDEAEQLYLGRRATLAARTPLLLLDLPPGESRDQFYRLLTGKNPSQIRAYWSRMVFTGRALPPKEAADASDARRLLLENPGAIGYLPSHYANDPSLRILLHLE
ncbi:hypothetical protein [Thauera linaloolentis]|uniref:Phosphate ABC transporter substrate-binding protein n=1 Tax=Thauera linaloolentis (strain DSM 12138 / JCM 21573 / CCUG 41526 / CIP 105981 / IAM 15112 / NBRC 102519 / 47Lol) TaxID=1123367 RepID=N6Z8Q3_THAL4|nr:hypothetical protein [Thauera linaloolentis]ENO90738.1 hypothetical protein C666_00890 [Thauera linaloolentis 47Lol = DSM 12138]MCM8565647.1 hypothetical protein [Thauera linaloolentis]